MMIHRRKHDFCHKYEYESSCFYLIFGGNFEEMKNYHD
jgi:hypothetical protein